MSKMIDSLYLNQHQYEYVGDYPCPYPGSEDGIVFCKFEGRPAWWSDGKLYALVGSTQLAPALDWVSRLNGPTKVKATRKITK